MFDKPTSSKTLGLDLDDFSLKGAVLRYVGNKIKIDELFDYIVETVPTDEGNVKRFYIEEERLHLEALKNNQLIVTAAETKDVLVRPLELLLTKNKDIDAALSFQIEPILPYPLDQAVVDKILLSKGKEGSKLSVLILRKDHLFEHLRVWKALNVDSEVISAAPHALALFAGFLSTSVKPAYILHLGIENSFCILLDEGKLITAQAVSGGIKQLLKIYSEEKHQDIRVSYQELIQHQLTLKSDHFSSSGLKEAIEILRLNVTRTVYALAKAYKNKDIDEMMITGPGILIGGLSETFCASLNKTQRTLDAATDANASSNGQLVTDQLVFALPIGEALSGLPNVSSQINFRQLEFAYPEPWKRLTTPIIQYFALALGVAIALTFFGSAYVYYENGKIKQQYLELLEAMNKPYKDFEKEYSNKASYQKIKPAVGVIPLSELSTREIEDRLILLEKDLLSTPQIFPLQPNVPLVSDVLAWITNHPIVTGNKDAKEGNQKENPGSGFLIENFSYTMVKRPEPTKKQEKYQVKVELEFSTSTPKLAREFHDTLIAPNDIVDPKGEIKWSSNRDKYRTSFYLKDKTIYPNL